MENQGWADNLKSEEGHKNKCNFLFFFLVKNKRKENKQLLSSKERDCNITDVLSLGNTD